jgi:hypothetical protein
LRTSARPELSVRCLNLDRLLSGLAAGLGLRQQKEGDTQQRDGNAEARRSDRVRVFAWRQVLHFAHAGADQLFDSQ